MLDILHYFFSIIHAQIQEFFREGPGLTARKQSGQFFFSPQLILQFTEVLLQRKLIFTNYPEGVQHFPGDQGVQLFPGVWVQMQISIETHITCDFFRGGVRTPYPPSGSAHVTPFSICNSFCQRCSKTSMPLLKKSFSGLVQNCNHCMYAIII